MLAGRLTICGLAAVFTVASGTVKAARPAVQAQQSLSTEALLQAYVANPTGVAARLGGINDLDRVRKDLDRLAGKFLAGGKARPEAGALPPVEQRRRDLTTFALDIAGANVSRNGLSAQRLVEWACYDVRRHTPPSDFDRAWQMTALALLEGEVDPDGLRAHLSHLDPTLRAEPRFRLAEAIANEQATAPLELLAGTDPAALERSRNPTGASRETMLHRAASSYQSLLTTPAIMPEATVRLAHVQLTLGDNAEALATLAHAEAANDVFPLYLGRLFKGIALERLGRHEEAQEAFRLALDLSPNAHAPTMALAASLTRTGHLKEAIPLVDHLVSNDDPQADFWWSYWAGDFRLWGRLIGDLRDGVK